MRKYIIVLYIFLTIVFCGSFGQISSMLGYGFKTLQYWLITVPICGIIGLIFSILIDIEIVRRYRVGVDIQFIKEDN